ncbi:MAG TPA: ABC transporter ATP-binding protein [Vicinamibacterales bacterium]|nr:ABC transporter ATP-binding protein [Vicinamibacterales bacterium]
MSDPIISVENLGKRYNVRQESSLQYVALRDVLTARLASAGAWLKRGGSTEPPPSQEFWALREVSFDVDHGQVVGIIGHNGAGKSTLLKVLSRITEPTEGRVSLDGRIASLLEVGTGFHPELTGRENIMLNGAILGMTRAEIVRKFDEIVAFAEVERFLETPVKRYSSGMYMRLAFAVAAHLDPEILVVDEVLAVGDAHFQKKCLGRMSEVAAGGRTVLFVSHNMNAVESLCTQALYLERGHVVAQGHDVRAIVTRYLGGYVEGEPASVWMNSGDDVDHPVMQPLYFAVEDADGRPLMTPVRNDDPLFVVIRADVRQLDPALCMGFALFNQDSQLLLWSLTTDGPEECWPRLERGIVQLRCQLPKRFLNEGTYRVELNCSLHCREWLTEPGKNSPAVHFEIQGGLSDSPYWLNARPGILAPGWRWERTD